MVACFPLSNAQTRLSQTPGRRRPLITGRFGNTAVRGPALHAISIRAAVACVSLLLCAGWRQHIDCLCCAFVAVESKQQHPFPCPASEARAPVCPTWLTKYLRPLCSWSRVGGNINTFLRCLVLTPDRLLSSPVCQQYTNSILPIRHSSCRYNEQQLIDVTVVRRVRPRAERSCDCEGHRRWKRACRTLFCN